ncbi:hypothetical protein FFLO_02498 [Filobasidium floriforme]|uniref:DNA-directed RNA polymerase III subunit RPC3 n=1 Tax=Filobasidium floriforme TaxID=5210 RepID=A0A8K0JMR5_9TREE|nr:hypothetical protein FFLO_02498 [Filobasidium floriforme]
MADKEAVRLAEYIIRADFGNIVASVASILLHRGRMRLTEIAHFTKLPRRQVAGILITLVQHNLAWHCETELGQRTQEFFEMNLKECLMRLRWGRILELTQENMGEDARLVVQVVLQGGKLRLPHILQDQILGLDLITSPSKREVRKQQLTEVVYKLIINRYIQPTTPILHRTPYDEMLKKRKAKEKSRSALLSVKELAQIKSDVMGEMRDLVKEETSADKALLKAGVKRKADAGIGGSSKKHKGDELEMVDPKAMLRINYERFDCLFRNKLIELAVADRYNKAAGFIVKGLMNVISAEEDSLLLETSSTGGMQAVFTQMREHERDSLSLGFGGKSLTSKSKIHELLAGYAAILAGEDDQNAYRAEGVFLGRDIMAASASGPQYMVLFERICSRLKRQLLESFVEETQGPMGKRVFNAVMHGDKVTEEMVVSKALIKGDDARIKLSALKTASLVTFQAISRTADRSASRCTFLYYVDLSRAYQTILSRMYKSLANIHQRKEMIYQEYEETFNNSQRSDVLEKTGKMDERDQVNLVKMEKELDKLNTAQLRMETNVFVLRDLPGGPLSVR